MGRTLEMEFLKPISDWLILILSGIGSFVLYYYKRSEDVRKLESDKFNSRLERLEREIHRLDRTQAETAIEIRAIKEDIGYIRIGLDKLLERL